MGGCVVGREPSPQRIATENAASAGGRRVSAYWVLVIIGLGVRLRHEGLLTHIVPAAVLAKVHVARLLTLFPQLLAEGLVRVGGGAHVSVEFAPKRPVEVLELRDTLVDELLRRHALVRCRVRNLLPVLVRTGQEEDLAAVQAASTAAREPSAWTARCAEAASSCE
jgi:hypothetical protein